MLSFSMDVDLARFEPGVFWTWFLPSQIVCSGDSGLVAGTQFTAGGVDFTACGVQDGHVIWLESTDQTLRGAFEVVEVVDATHLKVSVVRVDATQPVLPVGSASGLTWRIVSYAVQGYEVLWRMSQRLGLSPGCAGAEHAVEDIVNPAALRQASVFGTLALVFQAMHQGLDGQAILQEKAEHYQRQFDQALNRLRVNIDTNDDTHPDQTRRPDTLRLCRK